MYSEVTKQLPINPHTRKLCAALCIKYMEVSFCASRIGSVYLKDSFHAVGWDVHACPAILRGTEGGGRNHVFMPPPAENLSRYQTDWLHLSLMCYITLWARLPPGWLLLRNISRCNPC
jgi:hypothetical protein